MQTPRLPSMFRSPSIRRFQFSARYYSERKERLDQLKEGKSVGIKFTSSNNLGINKGRTIRLISVIIILVIVSYIILK